MTTAAVELIDALDKNVDRLQAIIEALTALTSAHETVPNLDRVAADLASMGREAADGIKEMAQTWARDVNEREEAA